jgi:hypothetical protein
MEKSVTAKSLNCDGCPVVTTPPFLRTGVVLRQMKKETGMTIQRNIKIPTQDPRGRKSFYGFGDMRIGDSIFFDDAPGGAKSRPAAAARAWAYRSGAKVTVRTQGNGVRVWRVS